MPPGEQEKKRRRRATRERRGCREREVGRRIGASPVTARYGGGCRSRLDRLEIEGGWLRRRTFDPGRRREAATEMVWNRN
jgi:hypothetical protein